jgi:hypothetical protein
VRRAYCGGLRIWLYRQSWLCPTEALLDDPEKTMVSLDSLYNGRISTICYLPIPLHPSVHFNNWTSL